MNKTILKIANLISMSPQSGKESGLMGGKMGRTLFSLRTFKNDRYKIL